MIFQRIRRYPTDRRQPGERKEPAPSEHRAGPDDRRVIFAIVSSVGVLAIASTIWIYAGDLTYEESPPIRADGSGYYVYLPAVFLDHDLTLRRTLKRSFKNQLTEIVGVEDTGSTSYTSTGEPTYHRLFDRFGVGVAMLALPFFAVGHTLALLTDEPQSGFSWPYQVADSAAGLVYVLLGL